MPRPFDTVIYSGIFPKKITDGEIDQYVHILYGDAKRDPRSCQSHSTAAEVTISGNQRWGFPEMGVPPNHPFINECSIINQAFLDTPIDGKSPR